MLVNVGLSYYMEGEHRQGVSSTRVFARGLPAGGCADGHVRPAVDAVCGLLTPSRDGPVLSDPLRTGPTRLEGSVVVRADARRAEQVGFECWDRRETDVDSARVRWLRSWLPLGDGWPSRDLAVDAPAWQDGPARDGIAAWFYGGATRPSRTWKESRRAPLTLLRAMQRDVDLIAFGQFCLQPANRRYAAFWQPSFEVRPLVGSLHRRGRLQSDGLGERS